ncbi:putative nucleoside-diphosphate sugar epimerase [Mycobacteroides abscessus subsp. abscessus]|nr:putative nucleoside-diphosphate sugar epimerase [Mycobacteroides abscessus subsp. abscessus]
MVSLGGVGVGNQLWTGRFKQELRDTRITPTEVIAEAVRKAGVPTFLSASASGYYGDTGEHAAIESDGPGSGFLADLVVDWEDAAVRNAGENTRVVLLRTAPVLSGSGGLLAKLRPLFKLGLGGTIGSGRQYFSWITLVDEIRAIEFLLSSTISGPVNLAAPDAVPFADFVSAFGRAVHRPTIARVPGFAAKFVGGEMAQEMILFSQRVAPGVLTDNDFTFTHPDIDSGLAHANR